MRARRAALQGQERALAAAAIAAQGLGFLGSLPEATVIAGFASLPEELDAAPLLHRLAADGLPLALPAVQGKGLPLIFRQWAPGDSMDRGVWGIAEPRADKPVVEPDIVLAPLLAFDRAGWRLGYGAGFYDRTLRLLRARKPVTVVGLAYAEQRVDAVPRLDYDERLDWVLLPCGPIKCTE